MSTEQRRLGKYELRERLGQGSMAEVWKAFDPRLQRYVALKILHANLQHDPEFVTRFEREASVIASLHHPNIVQLHDFQVSRVSGSNDTNAYMVMDYIQGQTLANYIAQTSHKGQFPSAAEIVHLFTSIGLAIDYAHQKGFIHRDIKPANILLDQRNTTHNPMGEPILTDFGMVKLLGTSSSLLSSIWLGSPLYIAPEQAQGYPGNERSDMYALGVILYELCTGVLPFQGETAADILNQHISALPISPAVINRNLPPAVTMVILRCLAKDPAARFTRTSYLTIALARAFNLSVPESLSLSSFPPDIANEPTYYEYKALQPDLDSGTRLSSHPLVKGTLSPLTPVALSAQQFVRPGPSYTPVTPYPLADTALSKVRVGTSHGNITQMPMISAAPLPKTRKKRNGLFITLLMLFFLMLTGSGLGTWRWLTRQNTDVTVVSQTDQNVGYAFFMSSGQFNEGTNQGINDELQINLQHIPDPAPGKSYYAWLKRDQPDSIPISLGSLLVKHGVVHFLYTSPQHTNLLEVTSGVLITEEDANIPPLNPSPDFSTWRYNAELPHEHDPNDTIHHYSMLDHLRHLLDEDPTIESMGMHGGLSIWLLRNTGKILGWADSARDYWGSKPIDLRNNLISILNYLVGTPFALLGTDTADTLNQKPTDYLSAITGNLNAIALAPGRTPKVLLLAAQINKEITHVVSWLEQVRQDATQLVSMTDMQLYSQQSHYILDDMATQAFYAYAGQFDLSTNSVLGGVTQINFNIAQLAAFDIKPSKISK